MKFCTLEQLGTISTPPSLVTVGTFDGVHLGHQSLLLAAANRARAAGLTAIVVTFEPIPASVLRPDQFPGRICSCDEKLAQIREFGFDHVAIVEFNMDLAARTPEQFMSAIAEATSLRELWIGESFALGKGRSGGVERLTEIGADLEYAVTAVPRSEDIDGVISSTRIRHAILLGDVSLANRLLGRPFSVSGVVVQGAQFGRTIGFPTANVFPPDDLVPLADGIYASRVILPAGERPHDAMTYVGTRPTVNTGARQIETNLLDFDDDLYGQVINVELMQRLRPDEHFPTIEEMIEQLRIDEGATRAFFLDLQDRFD